MPKLRRHCHLLHLIIGLIYLCSPNVFAARPPPQVHINKCCRIGEYLDTNTKSCVPGSSDKWAPMVYMILRKMPFPDRGEFPNFFKIKEGTLPTECTDPELFSGDIVIFSNGTLYLYENKFFVPPENYCADKGTALACLPRIHGVDSLISPRKQSKVRKCCGQHAAYHQANKTCEFYTDERHPLYNANIVNSTEVDVINGYPACDTHFAIAGTFQEKFLNVETGELSLESGKKFEAKNFCLELTTGGETNDTTTSVNMFACADHFAVVASAPKQEHVEDIRFALYSIGLLISVVFLLATLAAGFLMPSNHHLLHWKCQMYYIFCLLVGDLLLGLTQIMGHSIHGASCVSLAIAMHFFFLAAFFWLNTMCFNIWWTFRDFRPTSLEKNQELLRFRIYCVYAWGLPLIICGIGAILDSIPPSPGDNFLRPRFGEVRCWFYGDLEILTYFFGPIGILLCINLLLFASTARQLTCGLWKLDDVKSTTERAALGRVCVKLVVVMGITWVADIISWVVGGPHSLWYLTDLINALQGVFIFIVVGCQPQVWAAVKRLWNNKTGQCTTTTTHGPQHSSSSHGLPSLGDSVTNNTLTNTTTTSTKIPMETVC